MAKKDRYYVVAGTVQFDPEEREYNGSTLTDVVLKTLGSQKLVKVTIWPEFDVSSAIGRDIDKGDFVVADGKYTSSEHKGKTYHNVSPFVLHVNGERIEKSERDIVNDDVEDDVEDEDDAPF